MRLSHTAAIGFVMLTACEVTTSRATSDPSERPAPEPTTENVPPVQGAATTPEPAATEAPANTASAAAPTTSAAPSSSVAAEPIKCGSRFPPCPAGKTCSSPNRGVCQ